MSTLSLPVHNTAGIDPVYTLDLSGKWDFTPENQPKTTIQVPGGGWLKQGFDCEAGVYERRITIPSVLAGQVTRLELGAVNHQADVFIGVDEASLKPIHSEITAFTGQSIDLTPHVQPGKSYLLRIAVRAYQNGRPIAPHWAEWCEAIARGIFRSASLGIYPPVYLQDAFVRTSVQNDTLSYTAWITNATTIAHTVRLGAVLQSWDGRAWAYPSLPETKVTIRAGETVPVEMKNIPWKLGPESYWWPNLPYQPGYQAQLHLLRLTVRADGPGAPAHTGGVRFGFRELRQHGPHFELNGQVINFRGDNLQVANYDRVDHNGVGDAIDTLPGFLPPSAHNPGWPKAVDNFLRLNYTVQREHMGPWSPYMIDVCDEMGLMLIGESATRWDGFDMENGRGFHEVKCLEDIILRDRNHPSIVRWSSKNEAQNTDPAYHVELYEAIKKHDDTRPISEDIVWADWNQFNPHTVLADLLDKPDFTWIDHYLSYNAAGQPTFNTIQVSDAVVPAADRPYGMGEGDWMRSSTPAGLAFFAATIALARYQGASDVRPYVLLSSWVSSVPGVKTTDIITEENRHPTLGDDNLTDPWSHPGIRLLQHACHPLLAMDADFWRLNKDSDAWGHFPVKSLQLPADTTVTREITVFNDELQGKGVEGDTFVLNWELREGSLNNHPRYSGSALTAIQPGGFYKTSIEFQAPIFNTFVFLTLKVVKNGVERFVDEYTTYEITGGKDFQSEFNGEERKFK
jgi:hypothetical protein